MRFKVSKKIYIHVDCDSFFASCEIFRKPELKKKYVCVGTEIVVACCYKSKALGIKVGTPVWEAKRILKHMGVFLASDIAFYTKISAQIMDFLREETLSVEIFSIDEAFCEVTGIPEYHKCSTEEFAKKLQNTILKHIGIPVSIGISNTRIKAKIFSKVNKPYGICIPRDDEIDLFQILRVKEIPFIGKSSQNKLKYKAVFIKDFLQLGFRETQKILGKNGANLWLELMGVDVYILKKSQQIKSISRTRSFNKKITFNKEFLWGEFLLNFERAFEVLYQHNLEIAEVGVMFRNKNFEMEFFYAKIPQYSNNHKEILDKIGQLFQKNYQKERLCRSTGIFFHKLRNYLPKQASLFDPVLRNKDQNYELTKKIQAINTALGDHKVTFGTSLLGKGEQVVQKLRT
ncbi:MAG: hypothetical protein GY828_05475 [Candidatus Gracilibacteria bacterium]|nr:hypothetical protein [Candidatus Gracilibacteria bacterium]